MEYHAPTHPSSFVPKPHSSVCLAVVTNYLFVMDPVGKGFSLDKYYLMWGMPPMVCPPCFILRPHFAFCLAVVIDYLFVLTPEIHLEVDRVRVWSMTTWSPTSYVCETNSPNSPWPRNRSNGLFVFSLPGNFHIRNGAWMWRLNWLADVSAKGMDNSFGLMMNYKYVLEDVDKNNQQYLLSGTVAASPQFLQPLQ